MGEPIVNYENITDEQKARLKAAKSPEEILGLAQEEGYELSDDDLDGISGGWSCDSFGERSDCHLNQWYE